MARKYIRRTGRKRSSLPPKRVRIGGMLFTRRKASRRRR